MTGFLLALEQFSRLMLGQCTLSDLALELAVALPQFRRAFLDPALQSFFRLAQGDLYQLAFDGIADRLREQSTVNPALDEIILRALAHGRHRHGLIV